MPLVKCPGQVAFEAYNENRGGRTWDGKPTPPWTDLTPGVREGWQAAALAVRSELLREGITLLGACVRRMGVDKEALLLMPHHELVAAFRELVSEVDGALSE